MVSSPPTQRSQCLPCPVHRWLARMRKASALKTEMLLQVRKRAEAPAQAGDWASQALLPTPPLSFWVPHNRTRQAELGASFPGVQVPGEEPLLPGLWKGGVKGRWTPVSFTWTGYPESHPFSPRPSATCPSHAIRAQDS